LVPAVTYWILNSKRKKKIYVFVYSKALYLQPEVHLMAIWNFGSYITENSMRLEEC
jgi:hypothetical protein